ncbi:MAG TPA: GGDEF domain-containing protein, partial [Acholeplasma sp.]|nr:GGDEF domain-containing protein [Acholeplasma sp.]
ILPIIWTLYISYKVNLSIKSTKKLAIKLIILFVINLVFVSIMIVSGLFYTINASNIYARGPLFALSYIMPIGLLLYSFYFIFTNQKRIDGSHLYALMFFAIPPIIAAIAQGFVYGFSLIYNSITISILLIFIKNQANQMDVDYLTNVYNRKKLQNHLTERINNTTRDGEFAAMMIDLDGFKVINDTYGHTEGDQALRIVADLIKKAVGKQVLVARYGGDEFCLVLDVKQATDIAKINDCINRQFNAFNALNIKPYQLSFSMGYEVFNKSKHKNVDVFIDVLDKFMYKDKGKKKTTQ